MSVNIRDATLDDVKGIHALIVPLTKKYICPTCAPSVQDSLLNSMSETNIINNLFNNYHYAVAVNERNDVIGVAGIRDLSHLHHLFVHEKYQGTGVSRKLWEQVKLQALKNGNSGRFTVNSAINAENTYLRFGFIRIDDIRHRDGMVDIPMVLDM